MENWRVESASGRSRPTVIATAGLLFALLASLQMAPVLRRAGDALYVGMDAGSVPPLDLLVNAPHPRPRVAAGAGGMWGLFRISDTLRGVYTLTWWAHRLGGRAEAGALYDANLFFPTPNALLYADLQLGVVPWFAPLYALTGNPVLAYQLTGFVGAVGTALLFCVLVRGWTGSTTAGLVTGISLLVAPYRLRWAPLVYLQFLLYLPVALLCVDAIASGRRVVAATVGLGAALVLQSASSGYLAYLTFLLVPIHAAVATFESPPAIRGRVAVALLSTGIVAAGIVAWLYHPFAALAAAGTLGGADIEATGFNPLLRMVWGMIARNRWGSLLDLVGLPFLALAGLGLFDRHSRRRLTAPLLLALGLVLILGPTATFGPVQVSHLPWEWLAAVVPGFKVQRHLYLPETLVGLGVSMLAGQGAGWLMRRARAHRAWLVLVAAFAMAIFARHGATWPSSQLVPVATGAAIPPAYQWLRDHGDGKPLLELPADIVPDAIYPYFSVYHWLPLANGSSSYPPPGYEAVRDRGMQALSAEPAAADALLAAVPVAWVLVHTALLPSVENVRLRRAPPARLERVAEFGTDIVFRVRTPD